MHRKPDPLSNFIDMTTSNQTVLPRLDVLLYGHDGRGLGHAARSVGIGMALRRCYPELKVLFISGSSMTGEMVAGSNLDWLKLPSYKTRVVGGKSQGVDGESGFSDHALGVLRTKQLEDIVKLYRPRLVLVDHTPQGKHRELVQAVRSTEPARGGANATRWLLGVRGVVGDVPQAGSELGRELFNAFFSGLLWYGDSQVLGTDHLKEIEQFYRMTPLETGYVSRMHELNLKRKNRSVHDIRPYAGTISIPWLGEEGERFLRELSAALRQVGADYGPWKLFVPLLEKNNHDELSALFDTSYCDVEEPSGHAYIDALGKSRTALIYGGYNSLMDVISAGIPGLAIMRPMRDNEQQLHTQKLVAALNGSLAVIEEQEVTASTLADALLLNLNSRDIPDIHININGAEHVAHHLASLLDY